jgi:acid stress-induced BolA-like protein IbaG/YrbA
MQPEEIKAKIEAGISEATVIMGGEGCNAQVTVVSAEFEGKSLLQQQRMVYATLGDAITSGALHALSIKSYTPDQWQSQSSTN